MSQKNRGQKVSSKTFFSPVPLNRAAPLSLSFLLPLPVKLWDQLQGVRPQEQQGQRTQHCGLTLCVTETKGSLSLSQIILILLSQCQAYHYN